MKKILLTLVAVTSISALFAQIDSTSANSDTIKVGNYVIVKKGSQPLEDTSKQKKSVSISVGSDDLLDIKVNNGNSSKKKNRNISTNWWIFDLGFANFRDQTNYAAAQAGSYFQTMKNGPVNQNSMNLINGKSSNVNLWFFMQKMNVYKHKLNLKYGLGLEMYNYRFEHSLSYRKDPINYVFNDSISFSKNKLYAGYITVPFMINFTPMPEHKKSLSISAGISAGYLISSRNKQISAERGKQKISGNFDLEPFRLAIIGELGLGQVRLYGSYSLNALHKESTGLQQFPYALGIRFSNL
ncbi:MAG: outer membrane beta-barrel protein [Chitinophagaceae bacterium]